jgi:phosphoheptose isomerase
VGGIKFSVRDGETGYLVPPNDPDALAERAAHLYRHPKLLAVQGRQAIRRVNDLFTWERVTAGIATAYEEVVVSGRVARRQEAARLETVDRRFDGAIWALRESRRRLRSSVLEAAEMITATFARDHKLLIGGNGGSAAEAQHFAAALVGRFRLDGRPGLPAIALCSDAAVLTAWSNDVGYDDAMAREVEALGAPGDLLVGLSTSGRSTNLVRAFERARGRGLRTLALVGGDGGDVRAAADVAVVVPSSDAQHIQEVHTVLVHTLCEIVEQALGDAGWFAADGRAAAPDWTDEPDRTSGGRARARGRRLAGRASGAGR